MATDALSLLFELTADGRPAVAEFQRVKKAFATEIAALRKTVAQSFTLPPIKLPTVPTGIRGGNQVDSHVKDFRKIEAESKKSAKAQEAEQRRLNRAVESLQRQRSAAIIGGFKAEERAAVATSRAQERAAQQASRSIQNAFRGIGPGLQSIGRTLTVGITAPLLALGAGALKSAKDLDANVNTLKAFTGSAEAAERRLAQLIKTARGTPGLTTNLALTLDAQLRVAQTTQEAIDRVLPAIGRLNAVSRLGDPQKFAQNLVQLVTQNFEKPDLKELVGQSPLAGQLITEIFNVDSPINAEAIKKQAKKLGLTTTDAFFAAFADAAQRNQGLATVTESIGTRFDKIVDRVTIALRPLGLAILNAIEPFVEPIANLVERVGAAFNSLSTPVKTAIIVIAGIAAAAGPVLFILGGLATAITGIVTAISTIGAAVAAVGLPAIIIAVAGIVVVVGRLAAILTVLGLAWRSNFLNIRGLTADAARAALEAFTRIKSVIEDATRRILPTLQSVTEKVLAVVAALWERFGPTVVSVVSGSFAIVVRIIESTLQLLTNLADLALKIIDGDWRGAWQAFSRIVINAIDSLDEFFNKALPAITRGFLTINAFLIRQAITIAQTAQSLATRFILAMVASLIAGAPLISDALAKMLLIAAAGVAVGPIGASLMAGLLAAMRKAANEAPPIPIKVEAQNVGADVGFTGGIARKKRPGPAPDDKEEKGADAAARRRIRLLEIEADKIRTLTDAQLAQEQIAFDEKRKSLEDYTNAQIVAAHSVLTAQLAVYARERTEAQKIRNESARNLALAEVGQREFEAQQTFTTKVAQLEANRRKEEFEAAKAHRQSLLELNQQADEAELARLEDLQRQGHVTAFDVVRRQAEIEKAARARRRADLELQIEEADQNKEDRKKILDELEKFDAESAESVRRNERLKREAAQETADAYRDYSLAIREALESTADAARSAAVIALDRLNARVFLTQRQRIERQFAIDKSLLLAEKRASDLRIDNAEREAVEKAKRAGTFGEEALTIEKTFNDLRLGEQRRFEQAKRKLQEDQKADIERADPNSARSLFGDTFADFGEAIQAAADRAGVAISNLSVILGGFGAAAAEHFANASAQAGNFISILLDGISQITAGLGDMLANWVLLGETGSAAFRKLIASTLAYYAKTFLIKALDNIGEGFSNLAKASAAAASGNLFSAALYKAAAAQNFISAAKYGIASAATAVAGRFAAGGSFKQSDTASRAINGGASQEAEPRNQTFNLGGQGPVESSSQATREGTAVSVMRGLAEEVKKTRQENVLLTAKLDSTLSRLNSMPAGQVVMMGAADAKEAIGVAVIDHSNSSGDFNERLQRNLGFA